MLYTLKRLWRNHIIFVFTSTILLSLMMVGTVQAVVQATAQIQVRVTVPTETPILTATSFEAKPVVQVSDRFMRPAHNQFVGCIKQSGAMHFHMVAQSKSDDSLKVIVNDQSVNTGDRVDVQSSDSCDNVKIRVDDSNVDSSYVSQVGLSMVAE
jgi:hypothetical protein